jgi:hypothetical protein
MFRVSGEIVAAVALGVAGAGAALDGGGGVTGGGPSPQAVTSVAEDRASRRRCTRFIGRR